MRWIWWAWPLFVLACAPGLRVVFDRCYRAFADHRYQISRACRLPGAPARGGASAVAAGKAAPEESTERHASG